MMSGTILDRYIGLVGSERTLTLIEQRKTLKAVECFFPSLVEEKDDPHLQDRLWLFDYDLPLFFLIGEKVDGLEDIRPISEATKKGMNVAEWNPWSELKKEYELMESLGRREHFYCYYYLMISNNNEPGQPYSYDFILSCELCHMNKIVKERILERHLPLFSEEKERDSEEKQKKEHKSEEKRKNKHTSEEKQKKENMRFLLTEFFSSFPTLAFLLSMIPENIPFGLACHHAARRIIDHFKDKYDLWIYANVVADPSLFDFLIPGKEERERIVSHYRAITRSISSILLHYLAQKETTKEMLQLIIWRKDLAALKLYSNLEEHLEGVLPSLVNEKMFNFLSFVLEGRVVPHSLCRSIAECENLCAHLPSFTPHRFCNTHDLLFVAIGNDNLEFVKRLTETHEDISSTHGHSLEIPLLYAYMKSPRIAEYLRPLYDVSDGVILLEALKGNLKLEIIPTILKLMKPTDSTLLYVVANNKKFQRYLQKDKTLHLPSEWKRK